MSSTLTSLRERCDQLLLPLLGAGSSEFDHNAEPHLYRIFEASAYSLTAGGKRVRPMLVYAAAAAINSEVLQGRGIDLAATAIELMHCYSLVHDDLPAMDDDDLRRGQPTCHVAFDEATAVLVGDALQARAFELVAEASDLSAEARLGMIRALAAGAGIRGMVGGQAIDIAAADRIIDLDHLKAMHALKTGALIRAAVQLGAIAAGASEAQCGALDDYANAIGLAFQVQDDVLDVASSSAVLGKTQGADAGLNKPTYVTLMGLEEARSYAAALTEDAIAVVADFGEQADLLRELARYITARDH